MGNWWPFIIVISAIIIIIIIGKIYTDNPFEFPEHLLNIYIDVTGKREPDIKKCIEKYLIENQTKEIDKKKELIENWKETNKRAAFGMIFSNHRLEQLKEVINKYELNGFNFILTRQRTKYRQINYSRYSYKVTVEDQRISLCYNEILEMLNFLNKAKTKEAKRKEEERLNREKFKIPGNILTDNEKEAQRLVKEVKKTERLAKEVEEAARKAQKAKEETIRKAKEVEEAARKAKEEAEKSKLKTTEEVKNTDKHSKKSTKISDLDLMILLNESEDYQPSIENVMLLRENEYLLHELLNIMRLRGKAAAKRELKTERIKYENESKSINIKTQEKDNEDDLSNKNTPNLISSKPLVYDDANNIIYKQRKDMELNTIKQTQDFYENQLIDKIVDPKILKKEICFTSATGTGKTIMLSNIINKLNAQYPNKFYFIITTLSRGQLSSQIANKLSNSIDSDNYIVYGVAEFKKNTKLKSTDILKNIPKEKNIIWFRDEGHIKTNNFSNILTNICFKIISMSATNKYSSKEDIYCNFIHTPMLRTIIQQDGTPEDAINKLLEVKQEHINVKNYNPCAIFRIVGSEECLNLTIELCKKYNLKYINITDEKFKMEDICKDDNEYDVIINKMKIIEGIDIRRAHVLFMDNCPENPNTIVQSIGRCRRNALFWRNDINIFDASNQDLLLSTSKCYIFYNIRNSSLNIDNESQDIQQNFCDTISVEDISDKINAITVKNGKLINGLTVLETAGSSGEFEIKKDPKTNFKYLFPLTSYYKDNNNHFIKIILRGRSSHGGCKSSFNLLFSIDFIFLLKEINKNNEIIETFDSFYNFILESIGKNYIKYKYDYSLNESEYTNNQFYLVYKGEKSREKEPFYSLYIDLKNNFANFKRIFDNNEMDENYFYNAIIFGGDMKVIKRENQYQWVENTAITSKINQGSGKLYRYISNNYKNLLDSLDSFNIYFNIKDKKITLDKYNRFNSAIGTIIELTTKLFLSKREFTMVIKNIKKKLSIENCNIDNFEDIINLTDNKEFFEKEIVSYTVNKYKQYMLKYYKLSSKYACVPTGKYTKYGDTDFVKFVINYSIQSARFFIKKFKIQNLSDRQCGVNLSYGHATAVADFIIGDTIVDMKCTAEIKSNYIYQLLSYKILATSLGYNIKHIMIYEVITDRYLDIDIENYKNISKNYA